MERAAVGAYGIRRSRIDTHLACLALADEPSTYRQNLIRRERWIVREYAADQMISSRKVRRPRET